MVTIITMRMRTTMAIDQLDVQSSMDLAIATRKVDVDHCVTCTPSNNHQRPSVLAIVLWDCRGYTCIAGPLNDKSLLVKFWGSSTILVWVYANSATDLSFIPSFTEFKLADFVKGFDNTGRNLPKCCISYSFPGLTVPLHCRCRHAAECWGGGIGLLYRARSRATCTRFCARVALMMVFSVWICEAGQQGSFQRRKASGALGTIAVFGGSNWASTTNLWPFGGCLTYRLVATWPQQIVLTIYCHGLSTAGFRTICFAGWNIYRWDASEYTNVLWVNQISTMIHYPSLFIILNWLRTMSP